MHLATSTPGRAIVVLLAALHFHQIGAATIESVRLVGDSNNYINIRSTTPHVLQCTYRAGYDDPVHSVNWYKDDRLVYQWNLGTTSSSAYGVLSNYVSTTADKPNLQNLNFGKRVSIDLSGNYICEVESLQGKARSPPFHLVILDVPSENYETNVTLKNEVPLENATSTSSESINNCTLLWDFKSPAIFPRPNVTCGYYSYLHDDVTNSLPAGLMMHLHPNGSWQASFDHTQVQISDIPRERRLGCSVSVPDTNYKKVVKFEDNFIIDHLIDSEGCESFFLNQSLYRLKFHMEGGSINCRGELAPTSSGEPIKVSFKCGRGEFARFLNGTAVSNWSDELTCNPNLRAWSRIQNGQPTQTINITESLPICVPYKNGGISLQTQSSNFFLLGVLILVCSSSVLY